MSRTGRIMAGMMAVAGLAGLVACGRAPAPPPVDFPAGEGPRTEGVVSPHWVKAAMAFRDAGYHGQRPARWRHDRLVVVEAAWVPPGKVADFDRGHVPGAVLLNTELLETGYPEWRLRPLVEVQQAIGRLGVTPDSTVVVYGRSLIAAARVWWVLGYAGVDDVRLMDGGFDGWTAAGFPVETESRAVTAVPFSAAPRRDWLATTDEIKARIGSAAAWLGDVRSVEEFAGRASGYTTLETRGRIPGAVHLGDADDRSPLYRTRDGRLRAPEEVRALWQRQGLSIGGGGQPAAEEVVFYCGGGWRSSLAFLYAWLLGVERPRNYSDGWVGWSTDYVPDPAAGGSTPGWRQEPTGNPVVRTEAGGEAGGEVSPSR